MPKIDVLFCEDLRYLASSQPMRKFSQCFRDYFAQNDPWRLRLCFKLGLGHTCTILLARYIICVTLPNIICQTVIPHAATRICCGKETTLRHAFFAWPETIITRMHVFNSWCYGNEIIDATTWKSLPGTIWCPGQCMCVACTRQIMIEWGHSIAHHDMWAALMYAKSQGWSNVHDIDLFLVNQ